MFKPGAHVFKIFELDPFHCSKQINVEGLAAKQSKQ